MERHEVARYPSDPSDEELAALGFKFAGYYIGDRLPKRLEGDPLPLIYLPERPKE